LGFYFLILPVRVRPSPNPVRMCHCAKQKIAVCHHHVINHFLLFQKKKIKTGNGVYIRRRRRRKVASVMGRKTQSSIGLGEKINAQYRINS
jgi:hypothetical protein